MAFRQRARNKQQPVNLKRHTRWFQLSVARRRQPRLELLEDRRLLAVDTIPADLQGLGNSILNETAAFELPIDNQDEFAELHRRVKSEYTRLVVKPVIDFLNDFNPVPSTVADFVNQPVLNVPGLNEILSKVGIPTTPRELIEASNISSLEDALEGLDFFFDIAQTQIDIGESLTADTIASYDTLFDDIESRFGFQLPFIDQLDDGIADAQQDVTKLDTLADAITDTLTSLAGTGPFNSLTEVLEFEFSDQVSEEVFKSERIAIPGFGAAAPGGFAAGATLGFSVDVFLDYSVGGSVSLATGLSLTSGSVAVGAGLSGDGSIGLSFAGFSINAAELKATLSGNVGVRLAGLDDGIITPNELIGNACYFETFGGISFRADATYLDPNPINQVGSIIGGGGAAEETINVFNEPLWSAEAESCDSALRDLAAIARVENGVLVIEGTPDDDTIILTLDNDSIIVSNNGAIRSIPSEHVELIDIDVFDGNNLVEIDPAIVIPSNVEAGDGIDIIRGGGGADKILAGGDNDDINGRGGNDFISGEEGSDVIVADFGGAILQGGSENDIIFVKADLYSATIVDGGGPSNGEVGVPPGDRLLVDLVGVSGANVPRNVSSGAIGSL